MGEMRINLLNTKSTEAEMATIERVFDPKHELHDLIDMILTEQIDKFLQGYYDNDKVNTATSHQTRKD
jgi:hypothetical protein